jgi:hypothetical protein
MARQDIAGLLTGISSTQRPNPNASAADWRMQFGQQQSEKMNQRLRGLTGRMSTQEALGAGLAKLDLSTPEGLKTVAKLQQSTGNLAAAAKTAAAVRELTRESATRKTLAEALDKLGRPQEAEQVRNKTMDLQLAQSIVLDEQKLAKEKAIDDQQRDALMRLAKSQKKPWAVEWLKSNGDVGTIASVLLKDPTLAKAEAFSTMYEGDEAIRVGVINGVLHKATDKGWEVIPDDVKLSGTAPAKVTQRKPTSVAVTKEDRKAYNAVLSEEPEIAANLETTAFGLKLDADQKTILIDKAHQIWKNADPAITREAALRQAAGVTKKDDSDTFGSVTKG